MKTTIGFMQGRLSPLVNGKIQAFPWNTWQEEFAIAEHCGFSLMEWTLDQEGLHDNPLMTAAGQQRIRDLSKKHGVCVYALTGDCFMQAPFYKQPDAQKRKALLSDFCAVIRSCQALGVGLIVLPLVDNGRIETDPQAADLTAGLEEMTPLLEQAAMRIVFESDFASGQLHQFIEGFSPRFFGINYDIGNSAALGFKPEEEIKAYGHRILHVHIKDRVLGGTTVPLGQGNADFEAVFQGLKKVGYQGNFVLQTARASNENHAGVLKQYRDFAGQKLLEHGYQF